MSILIDNLLETNKFVGVEKLYGGKGWYVSKPLNHTIPYYTLLQRIKDAWRILCGRGIAVHYQEDEQ